MRYSRTGLALATAAVCFGTAYSAWNAARAPNTATRPLYLALAVVGVIVLAMVVAAISVLGSDHESTATVGLHADRATAEEWVRRALDDLIGARRHVVKRRGVLAVSTPSEKAHNRVTTVGESVTVRIRDTEAGTVVEIRSRYKLPMRKDSGKNEENVGRIAQALARLDAQDGV